MSTNDPTTEEESSMDPITNSTMAHPVGTGVGVAAGALAGAAVGTVVGPIGTAVGAVVGAVAGGATGHATAAAISPTEEELYWSENHPSQEYSSDPDFTYEDYRAAYETGYDGPGRYDSTFESSEASLRQHWEERKGDSRLDWLHAKPAVKVAWDRAVSRKNSAGSGF